MVVGRAHPGALPRIILSPSPHQHSHSLPPPLPVYLALMLPQVFRPGAAAVRARWVRRQEWTSWVAGDPQTPGRATLDTHTMLQHLCSDWKDAQRGGTPLADTTTAPASASAPQAAYPSSTPSQPQEPPSVGPR